MKSTLKKLSASKKLIISNTLWIFLLLFQTSLFYSQSLGPSEPQQLVIYPEPPTSTLSNNRYTVRVKQGINSIWQNLFEYKTFVNSGEEKDHFSASSFVHFDFSGKVEIEVTYNSFKPIKSVKIRPESKNIVYNQNGNKITFTLTEPQNLSFEINGDRYKNLHIFANPIAAIPPSSATTVTQMNANLQTRPGINWVDTLWYKPLNNETIYIGGGEVFNGSIWLDGVDNVTITGRGVIDMTSYEKQYVYPLIDSYDYLRGIDINNSTNVTIDGIVINDPQQMLMRIYESDTLTINNVKGFSRVRWGDGIHMVATNNVDIENCFLRTSDDAIAIYPARITTWGTHDGNSRNISVKNTSLYADVAHAIEIGWHGLRNTTLPTRSVVENIHFEDIDILEHESYNPKYYGAISINCADNNYCQFISFKNINVENFTNGSLFNIEVEPASGNETDGYRIHNIEFDNLVYNHSDSTNDSEKHSKISGLDRCRYIHGVSFKNLIINNNIITHESEYSKLDINEFAYDVTFEQNYNSVYFQDGIYSLKNLNTQRTLDKTQQEFDDGDGNPNNNDPDKHYTVTSQWGGEWHLERIVEDPNPNIYKIKSTYYGETGYLTRSDQGEYYGPTDECLDYYLITQPWEDRGNQKWKIISTADGYRIMGAYDYNYSISVTPIPYDNDPQNFYTMAIPWKGQPNKYQRWEIKPVTKNSSNKKETHFTSGIEAFVIYPNPTVDNLLIKQLKYKQNLIYKIIDLHGRIIKTDAIQNQEQLIDVSKLNKGLYIISIVSHNDIVFIDKFLKE